MATMSEEEIQKIINGDVQLLVEKSEIFAQKIERNVSASQIRNVFGTMRKLQKLGWDNPSVPPQLILMKPRLAYMAARGRNDYEKRDLRELKDVLTIAINKVNNEATFNCFCDFFEAILAYHKAHGGN